MSHPVTLPTPAGHIRPSKLAAELGISRSAMFQALKRGTIAAVKINGVQFITDAEAARVKKAKAEHRPYREISVWLEFCRWKAERAKAAATQVAS